jgi:hypothetical protein
MNLFIDKTNNDELNELYDQFCSTVTSEEYENVMSLAFDYLNVYEDDNKYIIDDNEYDTLTELVNDNVVVQNQLIAELVNY